jgi:hypothetical protein
MQEFYDFRTPMSPMSQIINKIEQMPKYGIKQSCDLFFEGGLLPETEPHQPSDLGRLLVSVDRNLFTLREIA